MKKQNISNTKNYCRHQKLRTGLPAGPFHVLQTTTCSRFRFDLYKTTTCSRLRRQRLESENIKRARPKMGSPRATRRFVVLFGAVLGFSPALPTFATASTVPAANTTVATPVLPAANAGRPFRISCGALCMVFQHIFRYAQGALWAGSWLADFIQENRLGSEVTFKAH